MSEREYGVHILGNGTHTHTSCTHGYNGSWSGALPGDLGDFGRHSVAVFAVVAVVVHFLGLGSVRLITSYKQVDEGKIRGCGKFSLSFFGGGDTHTHTARWKQSSDC